MHIISSIMVRYQRWIQNNYEKTKYAKYFRKIHNSHLGESCFVIGNGPSLSMNDLDTLYKKHIDSFAVNRIYLAFEKTSWRPTYYVNTDEVMIKDKLSEVDNFITCEKYASLQNKFYNGIKLKNAHYFLVRRPKKEGDTFFTDCTKGILDMGTVTIACIQLAIHMGYKNIYLLGIDHNFDKIIVNGKEVKIDNSVKNYFIEGYDNDVSNEVSHNLGVTTESYLKVKKFADNNDINIINVSRQTKLEVFSLDTFENAVDKIMEV